MPDDPKPENTITEAVDLDENSTEDTGVHELLKFLKAQRKPSAKSRSQPAWRRVEDYADRKSTDAEIQESFDFDLDDESESEA